MSEEEGQGFVIRDRRGKAADEPAAPGREPSGAAPAGPSSHAAGEAAAHEHEHTHHHEHGPPLTFSSFVFSLGTSSLMLMGEKVDPNQPDVPVNLGQAKEIIDILSILEEKTRGNLTGEEADVLRDMLYALRLKYVDRVSGKPAPSA